MCDDTLVQIVRNASIETAVVTFDYVDMPCHENSCLNFSAGSAQRPFKAALIAFVQINIVAIQPACFYISEWSAKGKMKMIISQFRDNPKGNDE